MPAVLNVAQLHAPSGQLIPYNQTTVVSSNFSTPDLQNLIALSPLNPARAFPNASAKQERSGASPCLPQRRTTIATATATATATWPTFLPKSPKASLRTSRQTFSSLLNRLIDYTPPNALPLPLPSAPRGKGNHHHTHTHVESVGSTHLGINKYLKAFPFGSIEPQTRSGVAHAFPIVHMQSSAPKSTFTILPAYARSRHRNREHHNVAAPPLVRHGFSVAKQLRLLQTILCQTWPSRRKTTPAITNHLARTIPRTACEQASWHRVHFPDG
jgi:hypothetical protein